MQGRPVPGCLEWEEQLRELGCPEGFLAPGCQGSLNSPTHSFFFFFNYLLIFGCDGSSSLRAGFL